jgi:hypothetical protein
MAPMKAALEKAGRMAWRLGSNDPTTLVTEVGIVTDTGIVPPGDYRAAVEVNKDGASRLAIYEGQGHYEVDGKAWFITSAVEIHDRTSPAKELKLDLNKGGLLTVAFGPIVSVFPIQTIPALPAIVTDFANVSTRIECIALPISDGPMERVRVGTALARMGGGDFAARWAMYLTMKPDGAVLEFQNTQGETMKSDLESTKSLASLVDKMIADGGDTMPAARREGMKAFVDAKNAEAAKLEANMKTLERINSSMTIPGNVVAAETTHSTLTLSHERPVGSMILTFGAGDKAATFPINPRGFQAPRRR